MPGRPRVVLFDVFETMLRLAPLRDRFAAVGRPPYELDLFFVRLLRDGMALTLAGGSPGFGAVAAAALRTVTEGSLSDEQAEFVLAGFGDLPVHPDVAPALTALADAGVPAYAFTHGSAAVAASALERAGVLPLLRGVYSAEEIASFKPPARVYHWVCDRVGSAPGETALVAAHAWDTHGAGRAGLLTGYVTRLEGERPAVFDPATVTGPTLDVVVEGLLALAERRSGARAGDGGVQDPDPADLHAVVDAPEDGT